MADAIIADHSSRFKPLPIPDEALLRELYEIQGLTSTAIATHFGVSDRTSLKWLAHHGITRRRKEVPKGYNCKAPEEATLRDLYEAKRLTTRQIADRLGVSHMSVKRWLRLRGIKARAANNGIANRGIIGPTREELERMLHEEHLGHRGAAARYGVDAGTVQRWIRTFGIKRTTAWQTRTNGQQPSIDPEEVRLLYESGYSMEQIGAIFGVSAAPVKLICDRLGIEIRPAGLTGLRYVCSNGLEVRSSYEIRVAEWLIVHGVEFVYEPQYSFSRRLRADFLANGWYVEIWGITEMPEYLEKKRRKIRLCEIHRVPLIQINDEHFSMRHARVLEKRLRKTLWPAPDIAIQGTLF